MNKYGLVSYLQSKGHSGKIISAFLDIDREKFIPLNDTEHAYEDVSLSLGFKGSTISQPSTIAFMLDKLELEDRQRILEVGSGSGYVLALIDHIVKNGKIYGIEIVSKLVESSKEVFKDNTRVNIFHGNGYKGLEEYGPYDRILVSASCSDLKVPEKLITQLEIGGILIIPIDDSIWKFKKTSNGTEVEEFKGFLFVRMQEKSE